MRGFSVLQLRCRDLSFKRHGAIRAERGRRRCFDGRPKTSWLTKGSNAAPQAEAHPEDSAEARPAAHQPRRRARRHGCRAAPEGRRRGRRRRVLIGRLPGPIAERWAREHAAPGCHRGAWADRPARTRGAATVPRPAGRRPDGARGRRAAPPASGWCVRACDASHDAVLHPSLGPLAETWPCVDGRRARGCVAVTADPGYPAALRVDQLNPRGRQ
jgi:hypothetical protein